MITLGYIIISRHAYERHIKHIVSPDAQSMRHIVRHTLRATAAGIDLRNEVEKDVHRSNL